MNTIKVAKRCWEGFPYLHKEITREFSLKTGILWATPSSFYVISTYRCNARCTFCPQVAGRTACSPELSHEAMMGIVRVGKELSGSGGEPLVHAPIYDALKLAHDLGVDLGFTTNGYLLTSENLKRILACDPLNINISLESVNPEVNEQMRPMPGGTRRVLQAIDDLLAEKERTKARLGIIIKPTVTEINYRSLPELVRYFGKGRHALVNPQAYYFVAGGERFWVRDPDALSAVVDEWIALRAEGYGLIPDAKALRGMVDYFRSPQQAYPEKKEGRKKTPCTVGYRNLFFTPDGAVRFCEPLGVIGNVNESSVRDIWYGPLANQRRHQALRCNVDCQLTCRRSVSLLAKARAFLQMG